MMQFAARGALQVPPAENIEILVYLARHNKVFGDVARMTLAGWDVKASIAVAADPQTPAEVLEYFISPDNLRPQLLPSLLANPSVSEGQLIKLALSALRETIEGMLKSPRVRSLAGVLDALQSSPYLKKEEAEELRQLSKARASAAAAETGAEHDAPETAQGDQAQPAANAHESAESSDAAVDPAAEEALAAYLKEHEHAIVAEGDKRFQPVGGIVDSSGEVHSAHAESPEQPAAPAASGMPNPAASAPPPVVAAKKPAAAPKRENALQKISHLDVKGRIQLALKGNKEERALLIRDGTKIVAFAVLEAPKLSDGEVEKFASQKNVLEAVLRQIPLKRRFMKNYIVVRNLCANPRTPLDLGLSLMKNLLINDLKNISANKDVSETIRKLALKMYKQKLDASNKK